MQLWASALIGTLLVTGGVADEPSRSTLEPAASLRSEEASALPQKTSSGSSEPGLADPSVAAVGVIVEFEEGHNFDVPESDAEARDVVDQVIDQASQELTVTPEIESASELGEGVFSVLLESPLSSAEVADMVTVLEESPDIASVEPDWLIEIDPFAEEAFFARSMQSNPPWGLDRIDQKTLPLNNQYSHSAAGGTGVTVYVIDSGLRASHGDFVGRVPYGFSRINDGLGYGDCNGHGTHVAGTIAGTFSGVAKAARIVPVRVFDCSGSTSTSEIIAALATVLSDAAATPGPEVVNMSLGGPYSAALNNKVRELVNAGIPVVVASGNEGDWACGYSPASEPRAITVNSSDWNDRDSSFSNWGSCTDVYAPGEGILSASYQSDSGFVESDGTSMAAPHVTGAVAVLLSQGYSRFSDFESILRALNPTAIDSGLPGDPTALLFADPTEVVLGSPGPPGLPVATNSGTGGTVSVRWSAPTDDGGSSVVGYRIEISGDNGASWTQVVEDTGSASTSRSVGSLENGTSYRFRVSARNDVGWGAPSSSSSAVAPTGPPSAPVLRSVLPGNKSLTVTFDRLAFSAAGGLPVSYVVEATHPTNSRSYPKKSCSVASRALYSGTASCVVSRLADGQTYNVQVRAVNTRGSGPLSTVLSEYPGPRKFEVTSVPVVSGSLVVGQSLSAEVSKWSPEVDRLSYQWLRNGSVIRGATGSTYVLTSSDAGRQMSVRVTGVKAGFVSVSVTSARTGTVLAGWPFEVTSVPVVSGSLVVGQSLSAEVSKWSPEVDRLSYQWLRNGSVIRGATGSTYVLRSSDVGRQMSVRVTGVKAGYVSVTRESSRTTSVRSSLG